MVKSISVRGRKEIIAVYNEYAKIAGTQNTGRPQATKEFIEYVARLPMNGKTASELKWASKQYVDVSELNNESVPVSIKVTIDIDEKAWNDAMEIFKYVFDLKSNPQMPYFLRVAGIVCIKNLEIQNAKLGIDRVASSENVTIDAFKKLSTEDKLLTIYKLLLERSI